MEEIQLPLLPLHKRMMNLPPPISIMMPWMALGFLIMVAVPELSQCSSHIRHFRLLLFVGITFMGHINLTHSIPEACGNFMVDINQIHNWQNPAIDPNSINTSTSIPSLYRQGLSLPEGNRGNVDGGYEMALQGGEAYGSNIHGPQINNFVGLGGSKMYYPQDIGEMSIDNHGHATQFGCRNKIDGSFLSQGIDGEDDAQSKYDFSSRGISGKLDDAVSPQLNASHVRQTTGRSSLNPAQNMFSGFSSFQNNDGGFTSLGHNGGGWASSNNNVGVISGINTGLKSSPFHNLQKSQADIQRGFPKSGNRNLGFVGNRDSRYVNLEPYEGFVGEVAASSGPFSNSSVGLLDSGQNGASGWESESVKFTRTATQITSDQVKKRLMETVQNFSPEPSMVSSIIGFKGSSNRVERSGKLFPASKDGATQAVDEKAQLPRRKRVQSAGHLLSANDGTTPCAAAGGGGQFPKRIGVQANKVSVLVNKGCAAQAPGSGLFPQRLGIQVDEHTATQATGNGLFPKRTDIQDNDGHVAYAAEHGLRPKAIGVQTPNIRRPSLTTGVQGGPPFQFSNDLLGPTSNAGPVISTAKGYGLSKASSVLGGPSFKRSVIRSPPSIPQGQQRKRALQPPNLPSNAYPLQIAPAAVFPNPAHVPYIKGQGSDGLFQPTGEKCMLCKRDLSYTSEGPVYQPTVPPAVAVLPCGHTFHDHCLQLITPKDQSKDPPCIPCVIGET
ncbi:hypothetical protein U1Q18_006879 [Sarracenia purpurea var. burkii]